MKIGLLLASCLCLMGCVALRDDLQRAEVEFNEARYENVEVWLGDLELSVPRMERELRARFYYLRGVTSFRLGDRRQARHFLALCRHEAGPASVGLRDGWRETLDLMLADIEPGREASGSP